MYDSSGNLITMSLALVMALVTVRLGFDLSAVFYNFIIKYIKKAGRLKR
jgi:hypothetical protein